MDSYKGFLYAILSSLSYAIMPIFAKVAYDNGSNSTSALIFRFLIAGVILLIYLKIKKINLKINLKQFFILFIIGAFGYTITTETLFLSYNYLDVGLATTLHYIYPAIVCLLSFVFFKEKVGYKKIISLIFSILGVYSLIAFEDKSLNTLGIILALFSGLCYGLNVVTLSLKELKIIDHTVLTMYVCFGATLGLIIYGAFTDSIILKLNLKITYSYLGLSIISTIFSMVLLLKAIELIGSTSASILGTFEAIMSIFLGVIFLGEKLSLALILGSTLIVISTIILAKDKKNSANPNINANKLNIINKKHSSTLPI